MKKNKKIIIGVVVVILVVLGVLFFVGRYSSGLYGEGKNKIITKQEAKDLICKELEVSPPSDVRCEDIRVYTYGNNVTTIFKAYDDSVSLVKIKRVARYKDGVWILGYPYKTTHTCAVGRGHFYFSQGSCG